MHSYIFQFICLKTIHMIENISDVATFFCCFNSRKDKIQIHKLDYYLPDRLSSLKKSILSILTFFKMQKKGNLSALDYNKVVINLSRHGANSSAKEMGSIKTCYFSPSRVFSISLK